ncbi:MAG: NADAR family protein, partial [Nitrosopumilus sp.]
VAGISTPGQAKRFGRTFRLRSDWKEVRVPMMESILRRKFEQPNLKIRLLEIEEEIIEHNVWHDNFWGICQCGRDLCNSGKNILGLLLMTLRKDLMEKNDT